MNKTQKQVLEFHKNAGQLINKVPSVIDAQTAVLRVRLLLEEVLEFAEASGVEILTLHGENLDTESISNNELTFSQTGRPDLVAIADALGDINYVSEGAAVSYGIDLEPVTEAIHQNNMLKLINCVKDENGKVVKDKNHPKLDLSQIINSQQSL